MSTTAFTNAHVFDGREFLDGRNDVVVSDGVVVATGPGAAAGYADAEIVDLAGRTLLPGLIDLHVHMAAENAGNMGIINDPYSLSYFRSVGYLEKTLKVGITTVRDAGGADLGMKTAVDTGLIKGPRMRLAINIMSQTGGHGDGHRPSGLDIPLMPQTPGRPLAIADGPDECRKVARQLFRAGADHIKICTSGGVLSPTDDPRHPQFTVDEIKAIVEEAEAHGSYVMAHAQGTGGIQNALRGGVRTIEHGIYLDEPTIELFLEKDAWLVPTLVAPLMVVRAADRPNSGLADNVVAKARMVLETHQAAFRAAYEAGVNIAMGTDTGVGPHGSNLEELSLMHTVGGMTLDEVLRASTSDAAQFVGMPVGALTEGSYGDAVVLNGTLTDAAQLADLGSMIEQVYLSGTPQL